MMKIFNMNRKGHFLFALVIAAITVVACGNKAGNAASTADSVSADSVTTQSDDYVPQRSDYSFRSEVRTIADDGEVRWDTIVVYLTDAKGHTQQLYSQAQPLDTVTWSKGSIGKISEDDWNFDGIPDLQVCMGPMNSSGNFTYDVWIWNDQTHHFDYVETKDALFDPEIDADKKTIVSVWRLDDEVEIVRYKWKDGKLVETEREQLSREELADD